MVRQQVSIEDLYIKAQNIRKDIINMIYTAKTGHTGGALSATDILTTLYYKVLNVSSDNPKMKNRDRFVLSKGHSVEPLWCILADKGFFPKEDLKTFSTFGSKLIGHPNNKVPGVEMNTGSLGHGLSVANGMALAGKKSNEDYRVYTLMGDGEQAEGSVWEAAMFASHYKLDNLVAIVDRNGLQISGATEDVMNIEPFEAKWKAFGWNVIGTNGNDISELIKAFESASLYKGKPTLIVANTTKGKGVSFIENQAQWHHKVPTDDELQTAMTELDTLITNSGRLYNE